MIIIYLLLLVGACVCFGLGAFARPQSASRVNLVALGLLLFALVPTIQTLVRIGD